MGDPLGTTASIAGLIGITITLIQQIQNARDNMKGASKTLKNVSKRLEALVQSLCLVKEEERLQTPSVKQQVSVIIEVAQELKDFFERLRAERTKKVALRFIHALTSGDKDDKQLGEILNRLDGARDELILRISVTLVGLVGNLKDGFRVAYDVLIETNNKVTKILGRNLVLADRLKGRSLQETDGTVSLDKADIESLGLADPQATAARIPTSQLRIDGRTGNIKVEGSVEDSSTGISIKLDGAGKGGVADKAAARITSAIITGETGGIDVGQNAKSLSTGISMY